MGKYRLYVDEVGNPDLGNSDNPNHRFLSLTGIILDLLHVQDRVHPEMEGLKKAFHRLCEEGTQYVDPTQFQSSLTSRELKVKPKLANVAGLQLADLLAHPSRCEILDGHDLLSRPLAPFAKQIIETLQDKYDREGSRIFGKKFL
jgi:hypothetical protein